MRLENDVWVEWQEFCRKKKLKPEKLAEFALLEFTVRHSDTSQHCKMAKRFIGGYYLMPVFRAGVLLDREQTDRVRVLRSKRYRLKHDDGRIAYGDDAKELAKATGLEVRYVGRLLNGHGKSLKGWRIAE